MSYRKLYKEEIHTKKEEEEEEGEGDVRLLLLLLGLSFFGREGIQRRNTKKEEDVFEFDALAAGKYCLSLPLEPVGTLTSRKAFPIQIPIGLYSHSLYTIRLEIHQTYFFPQNHGQRGDRKEVVGRGREGGRLVRFMPSVCRFSFLLGSSCRCCLALSYLCQN